MCFVHSSFRPRHHPSHPPPLPPLPLFPCLDTPILLIMRRHKGYTDQRVEWTRRVSGCRSCPSATLMTHLLCVSPTYPRSASSTPPSSPSAVPRHPPAQRMFLLPLVRLHVIVVHPSGASLRARLPSPLCDDHFVAPRLLRLRRRDDDATKRVAGDVVAGADVSGSPSPHPAPIPSPSHPPRRT